MSNRIPPEDRAAEKMLPEYRHALQDAHGDEAEQYEVLCFPQLLGHHNVGVAYQVDAQRLYLMFRRSDRPEPDFLPGWLLDAAKELTLLTRTLVVPDQLAAGARRWAGLTEGVTTYKFLLRDQPTRLHF